MKAVPYFPAAGRPGNGPPTRRSVGIGAALGLLSCGGRRRKRIAVIPKGTNHIFWVTVREGALEAGEKFGVEILWNGPASETEFARQIQILESMVAQRVDGIALAAADRKALIGPVERAIEAGIPVTVFDSGLDTAKYTSWVATDNVEGGRMAARRLAGLVGGQGKVALLMHAPGAQSSMDREMGFREVLKNEARGLELVAEQFGMSDRAKALAAAENVFSAHPDLKGMFASAEPSSVGAALAVKSRNLAGKVALVAFDSNDVLLEELRNGVIDALVVQEPKRIGFEAVRTLAEKLSGKEPPKRIDLAARVLSAADLAQPGETKK
jgi:ribose transport system substrate-binding protein